MAGNRTKTSLEATQEFSPKSLASNGKPEAVISVSFAPKSLQTDETTAVLAVGLENGIIELWLVQLNGSCDSPAVALVFPPEHSHIAAVTKLAWRPNHGPGDDKMVLASCSMDHGCRIFEVVIWIVGSDSFSFDTAMGLHLPNAND
jgi:WD40 repeat protein